ncbi:uncharacterized protein LOC129920237 [Episyrphus balteatus]|uniref:uncharacterized protein LOC129920237 n=1 Tax=Episyrphus balteatus TaxID=286459 RepID=UPI0024862641|nr:uncharacterized protein LOC129920237 [Episyrphus balteatus]
MPSGVVFLIVVPTANFERELVYGKQLNTNQGVIYPSPTAGYGVNNNNNNGPMEIRTPSPNADTSGNNLNINLPDSNAVLRLEVELRDKNAPRNRRGGRGGGRGGGGVGVGGGGQARGKLHSNDDKDGPMVPMEKVLEELLTKLEIEHVTWSTGKKGFYYHVVFPLQSGEPCETTLHCLTELGFGTKLNSSVSVLPCSVSYDAISNPASNNEEYSTNNNEDNEDFSKWNNFVDSIKSKLTVKQVVDGVRAGGCLTFDYLLLIVTADSLAALGLIENNSSNIVAAMLVSPLMGPVMSITFGTIISDRELIKVGFISLGTGMFISCVFGFIFGLIVGTTEMPWGSGDWPTEEMRGRGNVRSLWMALPWALTSGTGVAVALLQGSTGPLIGVAISASLLPPVVNCGLYWALACIWLIYPDIKLPHLKGEAYTGNSSYPFLYTDYLPTEFLLNGIFSGLLTVVNVICIFITAIIILKIKEVSAPYTASPDLKRFWETDLRTVRKTNRSTIRNRKNTFRQKLLQDDGLPEPRSKKLDTVLEQAIKEATDDVTFKKVKRMSYSNNAVGELTQRLAQAAGLNTNSNQSNNIINPTTADTMDSVRNSKLNVDLQALDKLVSSLLEHHQQLQPGATGGPGVPSHGTSMKLNRRRTLSRSANHFMYSPSTMAATNEFGGGNNLSLAAINNNASSGGGNISTANNSNNSNTSGIQHTALMPTILEQNRNPVGNSWSLDRSAATAGVRNVLNSIANAPHRLSQNLTAAVSNHNNDEDNVSLTKNILD